MLFMKYRFRSFSILRKSIAPIQSGFNEFQVAVPIWEHCPNDFILHATFYRLQVDNHCRDFVVFIGIQSLYGVQRQLEIIFRACCLGTSKWPKFGQSRLRWDWYPVWPQPRKCLSNTTLPKKLKHKSTYLMQKTSQFI